MTSRTGLVNQLEKLRDDPGAKNALVLYLGYRATRRAWAPRYASAAARYFSDPADILLVGTLVRDVEPREHDLKSRAEALAGGCPGSTTIRLRAMYLEESSIGKLTALVSEFGKPQ